MRVSVIWISALEVCFGSVRLRSGQVSCFAFRICRRTGPGLRMPKGCRPEAEASDARRFTLHASRTTSPQAARPSASAEPASTDPDATTKSNPPACRSAQGVPPITRNDYRKGCRESSAYNSLQTFLAGSTSHSSLRQLAKMTTDQVRFSGFVPNRRCRCVS